MLYGNASGFRESELWREKKTKCSHHFCSSEIGYQLFFSPSRLLIIGSRTEKQTDGMIIRHMVIKMYYMLILYYEALERNVNLSLVYSVFKKQIKAPERSDIRRKERRETDLMAHGLQFVEIRVLSSLLGSRCFVLSLFSCAFFFHRLVSPSRFQLKLHLFPSSHPFLFLPLLPHVTLVPCFIQLPLDCQFPLLLSFCLTGSHTHTQHTYTHPVHCESHRI